MSITAAPTPDPVEPGVAPTPEQWRHRYLAASREQQIEYAEWVIQASGEARACLIQNHVHEVARLRRIVEEQRALDLFDGDAALTNPYVHARRSMTLIPRPGR